MMEILLTVMVEMQVVLLKPTGADQALQVLDIGEAMELSIRTRVVTIATTQTQTAEAQRELSKLDGLVMERRLSDRSAEMVSGRAPRPATIEILTVLTDARALARSRLDTSAQLQIRMSAR